MRWDGTGWSAVGGGVGDTAALTVFDDGTGAALYAAGLSGVRRWNGTSWTGLGSGISQRASTLTVYDDGDGPALYTGGFFKSAGGKTVNNIAEWDGSSWSALANGLSTTVYSLAVFDDGNGPALYAGGHFTSAGPVPASKIARWDGTQWSALGAGTNTHVYAMAVFDDGTGPALYAGGSFTVAGAVDANHIAKWDGNSWSALGTGINGSVLALEVFDDGTGGGPALYAAGEFSQAGGVPAIRIARWDGTSWSAVGTNGGGFSSSLYALEVYDDGLGGGPALFVGGAYRVSSSGDSSLAKWGCPSPSQGTEFFCTAKTALFCGPATIAATGAPSATASSGFVVEAGPVRGCRPGLMLYSNQPTQPGVSFGGPGDGLLCLSGAGLRRAGPIQSNAAQQQCDGTLAIDVNAFRAFNWMASGCNPLPGQSNPAGFLSNMGTTVNAQMWGRDSIATGQVLSNGIRWVVGP